MPGGAAQYDYVLGIGLDPKDVAQLQTLLRQLAKDASQVVQQASRSTTSASPQGIARAGAAASRAAQGFTAAAAGATKAGVAVGGFTSHMVSANREITHAIGKIATWGIATGLVYGAMAALRSGITVISEVDFALTGLRKVYQGNVEDIIVMKDAAVDLATTYGSSITAVINTMRDWARQGYDAVEVIELTRVALLAQNIAEMSAVDATKYLTAALNQFELGASKAMGVLDTWNELSNRYAATTRDIADGVARLGKTAYDAGISVQQASAMVAVLVESTKRTGAEIGTALRTIFTYSYRMKNMQILQDVGIFVRRQEGDLLPLIDVLTQLAIRWDTLRGTQKQAIAEAFGVRRITEFRTLLDSLPRILEATTIAYRSQGSAVAENIIFLDSINVRYEKFKAQLQIGRAHV